jgi:alkanesulfonate monooxygenase SsuD/methylene tetrahydromethanopterin reductase-like flavin-dependent oxidoreductase (luciferase family)
VRIGLVILPQLRWSEQAALWQRTESLGFDHVWTYDHLSWYSLAAQPWFATVPTLAAASLVTSTIPLGTWVATPNFRHPVPFAKDVLSLDELSDGRFVVGLGAGVARGGDAEVLGPPLDLPSRARRFSEFVDLLDLLLTQPETTWSGEFYTARDARMIPASVHRPRPPFVVSANGPKAMEVAVRHGQGWATTGPIVRDDPRLAPDQPQPARIEAWWEGVGGLVERLDRVCGAAGRDPSTLDRYLNIDLGPQFSLASMDVFTDFLDRARALGFTDVVAHWPRVDSPGMPFVGDPEIIEAVAARLPELRGA